MHPPRCADARLVAPTIDNGVDGAGDHAIIEVRWRACHKPVVPSRDDAPQIKAHHPVLSMGGCVR